MYYDMKQDSSSEVYHFKSIMYANGFVNRKEMYVAPYNLYEKKKPGKKNMYFLRFIFLNWTGIRLCALLDMYRASSKTLYVGVNWCKH